MARRYASERSSARRDCSSVLWRSARSSCAAPSTSWITHAVAAYTLMNSVASVGESTGSPPRPRWVHKVRVPVASSTATAPTTRGAESARAMSGTSEATRPPKPASCSTAESTTPASSPSVARGDRSHARVSRSSESSALPTSHCAATSPRYQGPTCALTRSSVSPPTASTAPIESTVGNNAPTEVSPRKRSTSWMPRTRDTPARRSRSAENAGPRVPPTPTPTEAMSDSPVT